MWDMMIKTVSDRRRGCGWRKEGGLYLVTDAPGQPCGKLPIPLHTCPVCGAGIKQARGWTWIDGDAIAATQPCRFKNGGDHRCLGACPLDTPYNHIGRAGLLWIGEAYYQTPDAWLQEAQTQGISRRIKAVPRGFEIGTTWVMLAHSKAVFEARPWAADPDAVMEPGPGIFHVFKPREIQYVVKGTETENQLMDLWDRGITPIRVQRVEDQTAMALEGSHG